MLLICSSEIQDYRGWIACFIMIFEKCAKWIIEALVLVCYYSHRINFLCYSYPLAYYWSLDIHIPWMPLKRKKNKELFFKVYVLISWEIFLNFERWPPGYLICKLGAIWIRHHGGDRAKYVWKLRLVFPVNALTLCMHAPFSWATRHTTLCLICHVKL